MNPGQRHRGGESGRVSLRGTGDTSAFKAAKELLARHLVHTREVANGRDFLFSGPKEELHQALRCLVDFEHRHGAGMQLDFAEIEDYFLLRVSGGPQLQESISTYFVREGN